MIKTKICKLAEVPKEKQQLIRTDIYKYLKGELKMNEINAKHDVSPWITQKLMRVIIGFDTKHNQLKLN
jgi:hypothetical protein